MNLCICHVKNECGESKEAATRKESVQGAIKKVSDSEMHENKKEKQRQMEEGAKAARQRSCKDQALILALRSIPGVFKFCTADFVRFNAIMIVALLAYFS